MNSICRQDDGEVLIPWFHLTNRITVLCPMFHCMVLGSNPRSCTCQARTLPAELCPQSLGRVNLTLSTPLDTEITKECSTCPPMFTIGKTTGWSQLHFSFLGNQNSHLPVWCWTQIQTNEIQLEMIRAISGPVTKTSNLKSPMLFLLHTQGSHETKKAEPTTPQFPHSLTHQLRWHRNKLYYTKLLQ